MEKMDQGRRSIRGEDVSRREDGHGSGRMMDQGGRCIKEENGSGEKIFGKESESGTIVNTAYCLKV